jgi:hypothetical protein
MHVHGGTDEKHDGGINTPNPSAVGCELHTRNALSLPQPARQIYASLESHLISLLPRFIVKISYRSSIYRNTSNKVTEFVMGMFFTFIVTSIKTWM